MFNNIITGVDGTDTAYNAAQRAAEMAQVTGATLHLVTAYGKYEVERIEGPEEFLFSTESDAETIVRDAKQALLGEFPDLRVEGSTTEGKPGVALVRLAAANDADLIVIGNKRVQGPARIFGSVARDVASKARCDVYVVWTHRNRGRAGR